MKKLNDYFPSARGNPPPASRQMSLSGKLEAIVGGYFLSGAGIPGKNVQTLYHDPTVDFYDAVSLKEENIVAYILTKEKIAFVREDRAEQILRDAREFGLTYIPVTSFRRPELSIDLARTIPAPLRKITWIDDDFLNDENIEFDFKAFEIIDSGQKYLNPKHFSTIDLIAALESLEK